MPKIPVKTQNIIWAISIALGVAMGAIAVLLWVELFTIPSITPSDFIALAILFTIAPL